jgi:membrane-bound inhibitor of C-type lysozyme
MLRTIAVAALLCGCATSGPVGYGRQIQWVCDGGGAFSMHLTDAGNAEVFAGGQTYSLPGLPAGSGTRYSNGSVEYWEHSGEAMLNGAVGGPYAHCHHG